MRTLLRVFLLVVFFVAPFTAVQSQDYEALFRDFNSSTLTQTDKRFLQAALAFEGHYNGLLDGDWGRLSRNAMTKYSRNKFSTATEEWHLAFLALTFFERYERDGWDMQYFPGLSMSVMLPQKTLIQDPPSDNFINYRHLGSSLSISIGIHDQNTTQRLHNFTQDSHQQSSTPYSVRKTNLAISSAEKRDGSILYTRSDFINGSWSTIMLSAQKPDADILSAVSSSITIGRASSLNITANGRLEGVIRTTVAAIAEIEEEERLPKQADSNRTKPNNGSDSRGGAGSGFVVSREGHILTNAHVVNGCSSILVDGREAVLVETSEMFDLAILKTTMPDDKAVAVFSASPAKLNSDVTVVGYPYAGLLSGLNVTRGSVSSLKGLGGDATTMQITAPVQSGNSGGPLLGADGEVVGVVVSKLDVFKMADATGDVPQNVNFAVRGEIAKLFLAQNGIDPILSMTDVTLEPEKLAEAATGFTAFVECQ